MQPNLPAMGAAEPNEPTVGELLDKTCRELTVQFLDKLPRDRTVAVLPLAEDDGGARRLGFLLAAGIERGLGAAGFKLIDRIHLNEILTEVDLHLAFSGDERTLKNLASADVLIVGTTNPTGREVLVSAKAMDMKGSRLGQTIATTGTVSINSARLGELMWYVRRPRDAGGELPPLALQYEFVSPTGGGELRLTEGATVRTGQKFRIRLQPNSDCYLYVLLYDSKGLAAVLFPHQKIGTPNQVRGGVTYPVPDGTKWYWFDEHPGTETFYIVASYTPLKDLDQILAEMQRTGPAQGQLAGQARERIDKAITRGMTSDTSVDFRPEGYAIQARGVGITDLGFDAQPAGGGPQVDNIVAGHATVVKKLAVKHVNEKE